VLRHAPPEPSLAIRGSINGLLRAFEHKEQWSLAYYLRHYDEAAVDNAGQIQTAITAQPTYECIKKTIPNWCVT